MLWEGAGLGMEGAPFFLNYWYRGMCLFLGVSARLPALELAWKWVPRIAPCVFGHHLNFIILLALMAPCLQSFMATPQPPG